MRGRRQPRILGIDDAPFEKKQQGPVPIVGVIMEGSALVEGVAISSFPVDGENATEFLVDWIRESRWRDALQAVTVGGVTLAGLGLIDVSALAEALEVPVLSVTRRRPTDTGLRDALTAAGLSHRAELLDRLPPAREIESGLFLSFAGSNDEDARDLLRCARARSKMPEPLRIAHLVGAALVSGHSRGRV